MMKTIYKDPEGKKKILEIYDKMTDGLNTIFESKYVDTRFGKTHILVGGNQGAEPLICFHGGNVVNPITLKWFEPLAKHYQIFAPDTIGHPGKSDEVRLNPKSNEYAQWVCDFMDGIGIKKANFIGPSYGGGILIRLAAYAPERIEKAVFLVPSAIAGGKISNMMKKILIPLALYKLFPNERNLVRASKEMFDTNIEPELLLQIKYVYDYVKLETAFPSYATKEELENFHAPTLIFAAEHDVFFPAKEVIPRAKNIFPSLSKAITLQNASHFQNENNLKIIIEEIEQFFI
ncbi:alpha/beta fold hydrolase [Bacillus sp. S/N-304-OC-R1]|uniref:alpha/beta fold hydrolase n=1 Tax=Bacillus sp. S/N-304-OC-R1 TaxID=2758034 RepID=UPI001C8D4F3A|nr:alpha/beta hydrolase [Bacillus sp. S/N-304-OC-R1]MBY0121765.1 alpha/beta hydrolase [Bacillus sp. S/N-304-OC-R1]